MNNIYLTGYRCTGKTTAGILLADRLGREFIDADEMLVKKVGMPVSEIVEKYGWDYFRNIESDVLESIADMDEKIVATGGGVVLRDKNIENMRRTGSVVWLKASAETIFKRMTEDIKTKDQRPGLSDRGPFLEIEEILANRLPLYSKAMDFSFETDNLEIDKIVSMIVEKISREAISQCF